MARLSELWLWKNEELTGALPERGLMNIGNLAKLIASQTSMSGTLPENGLLAMSVLVAFNTQTCKLTGSVPAAGLRSMPMLRLFSVMGNFLTGKLPEGGCSVFTALLHLSIQWNSFTGALPSRGLGSLTCLWLGVNQMEGALPTEGLRSMSNLGHLALAENRFTGVLPEEGLLQMKSMRNEFKLFKNSFAGVLPERGFSSVQSGFVHISQNLFSGTFPSRLATSLEELNIEDNMFQGSLPTELCNAMELGVLEAGRNDMEGHIPELGRGQVELYILSLAGLSLAGTMPQSLGRMKFGNRHVVLILGHGIAGRVPTFAATLSTMIVFNNELEGQLPETNLLAESIIVAHNNCFSCHLPSNRLVSVETSYALVGNHFMEPMSFPKFPPWISEYERGEFLCLSNRPAKRLVTEGICLCAVTCLLLTWRKTAHGTRGARHLRTALLEVEQADCRDLHIRGALHVTIRLLLRSAVISSLVMCTYLQEQGLVCTIILCRLQFPLQSWKHLPGTMFAEAASWLHSWADFAHWRRCTTSKWPVSISSGGVMVWLRSVLMWSCWCFLCVLLALPGAFFSLVKAIPGFWHVSRDVSWCVVTSVDLVTALTTSMVLPAIATKMQTHFKKGSLILLEMLGIGKLLITPLLPCFVTIACHEDCFGAWLHFWAPCQRNSKWEERREILWAFSVRLLSKHELCMTKKESAVKHHCIYAVVDRSSQLVLACIVRLAFTTPSLQLAIRRRVRLREASVLVVFISVLSLLFGPCIPMSGVLLLLAAVVHTLMLVGKNGLLHHDRVDDKFGTLVPRFVPLFGMVLALLMQVLLSWEHHVVLSLTLLGVAVLACKRRDVA